MAVLTAAAALGLAAAALAGPGLSPTELYRLRSVGEVHISPDARRILYTVVSREARGRPAARAFVLDRASGATRPLQRALAHPRWSPDGRLLAALVAAPDGAQLVVFRPDGSEVARLARVETTNHPLPSAGDPLAWAPDGRQIAFVSATPGPEPPPTRDPVVVTRYLYKPTASEGATRFNDNRRSHVFLAELATRRVRALTSGDAYEHSLAWSPDGAEIAYLSNREPDPERVFNYDVFAVRVADGAVRRLSETRSAEYAPAWSPDGRRLAFLGTKRSLTSSETTMEDTHAWVMERDGTARCEVGVLDNRQDDVAWSPDGGALYATLDERGSTRLYRLPLDGSAAEAIAPPAGQAGSVRGYSVAGDGTIALALGTPTAPPELFLRDGRGLRQLTHLNEDWLAPRRLAPVEAFSFPSAGGVVIEAFLTLPHGRTPTSRHPLIVVMHGGPHAQQGPSFDFKAQAYASEGFATLMVNYRGSTGYGQELADLTFGDQNGGEAQDVLTGVDAALARYPFLDASRLGLEGGSYGGQLANWLVTQTDRFRAAVSLAGIANLVSFNYMAYYHDYLAVEFGGYPHEGGLMDRLWERSPLRHVARVKTPLLLLHGENDNDVPVAEAEQFFIALKDVGVETVMVRYPREGHGLRETAHVVDALERSIAWYRRHFASKAYCM